MSVLTARQVASAKDGWHADGEGLYLRVSDEGKRRRWVFRFTRNGKTTEIGLGAARSVTLLQARRHAKEAREQLAEGKHPLVERRAAAAADERRKSFREVAEFVIERDRPRWGVGSLGDWTRSLKVDAEKLAEMDVASISVEDVKAAVMPMFDRGDHVAAKRTLGRIEAVLACAIAHGWRREANVAAWPVWKHSAPKREEADRRHKMIPWREAPAAIARLRAEDSTAARCVELAALTGVRISEAREATWSVIDLERAVWEIPPERMKMREPHIIPLSRQALGLLDGLRRHRTGDRVFPGRIRSPVSRAATWNANDRATEGRGSVHGWRSTFRSWCADTGVAREVAESALAHKIRGVQGAHNRAAMIERRRPVMSAWGSFLAGESPADVIPLRRSAE